MKIAALIAIRNEELYIGRKIRHLQSEGIDIYILDNASTDNSIRICLDNGIPKDQIIYLPFSGYFDLSAQLSKKHALRLSLPHDWIIHTDADEIITSIDGGSTIRQAIDIADEQGYNVINCEEFVFIPEDDQIDYSRRDYVREMQYYYYYCPQPHRLMRIFKNSIQSSNLKFGGHGFPKGSRTLSPQHLALRHYIGLNMGMIKSKYGNRKYSPEEIEKNWHRSRITNWENVTAPNKECLMYLTDNQLDTSQPKSQHFWFWPTNKT